MANTPQPMNIKLIITSLILVSLSILTPQGVYALEKSAGNSAAIATATVEEKRTDNRAAILETFLSGYNSPLSSMAKAFVAEADKNRIDWKLVAAISGVESTFGQQVPFNCNNAWGFGIYGTITTCFASYDGPLVLNDDGSVNKAKSGAIATISKALREDYMDKWGEKDVYAIGKSYAASPTWAQRVDYFMRQIESSQVAYNTNKNALPISL